MFVGFAAMFIMTKSCVKVGNSVLKMLSWCDNFWRGEKIKLKIKYKK
jgi:hypothetical protein